MDNLQLQESILHFSLDDGPHGNQGYSRVLLQLFGYIGNGKSSFINSCRYFINGEEIFIEYASVGEEGAMTMDRRAYELTQNITIVDNRGFDVMSRFERAEMYAQLGGFIPIDEEVKWPDNYINMMYRLEDAALNPNYSDFIVPILVYSARNFLSEDEKAKMKEFMDVCVKMTGVLPIIVITRKNCGNASAIEKSFRNMGAEVVTSIENCTKEDCINRINIQVRSRDILTIIHNALKEVKFRLGQKRNAQTDWVQRKMFLLQYIHNADQEKREELWSQEEDKRKREEERRRRKEKNSEERKTGEE